MTSLDDTPAASPGLPSPCIRRCQLDANQTCTGCRRTIDEIIAWSTAGEAEKAAVWQRLLALPMHCTIKTCQRCQSAFSCGSGGLQGGCWCADLPMAMPIPARGDCLCPVCLREVLGVQP